MRPNRTVLVVSKAPSPGRSKTRLVPPLSAEQAAELQRALLLDTLDACRAEGIEPTVLATGERDGEGALRNVVGRGVAVVPQPGRGLADALRLGMRRFLERGPVAMVASDVPGLPPGALGGAFDALAEGADVVLGPADDGGYWLIAMREAHDAPFDDIPWSTTSVCALTRARCEAAGLEVRLLQPWRDIDTAVDLAALSRTEDLAAARTAAFLRVLGSSAADGAARSPAVISSEVLLSSPWRSFVSDRLEDGDGGRGYAYLEVPRAAFVVPVTVDGDLVLVRQYRHPVRDWTLEVPAGTVDPGETPLEAAHRELAEEAGGRSDDWRHLSSFYSSSAHMSLRSDAFLARDVVLEEPANEGGEVAGIVRLPWAEAVERACRGAFAEGQTALAILLAAQADPGAT